MFDRLRRVRRGSFPRLACKRVLQMERLENRFPLAGAVIGQVFDDANENGVQDTGEELVEGITVYIDVNFNGRFDSGEPSDISRSERNAGGGNYRISNSLPNNTNVAVRLDVEIARIATPGLASSNWIGNASEVDDVLGDTRVRDLAEGDFDGDGNTDLAVLQQLRNSANLASVAIFLAAADGSFPKQPSKTIPVGGVQNAPTEFVSADLNGNGKSDLIIVDSGVGQVVLLGDFDGQDFSTRGSISVSSPVDVVVNNFDADADLEIAVLSKNTTSQVTLYQPISPFTYSGQTPRLTGRTNPGRLVADDFNNDQHLDLAILHASSAASPNDSREIAVLPGTADGVFEDPIFSTIGQRNFSSSFVSGQFVGDDKNSDLAVISDSDIVVLAGDGTGKFFESAAIDDSEDQGKPSRLTAFDVDGDGDSDLAFSSIREPFEAKSTDALVYENVGGSFVQRFRAFQVNVVFTTQRVVPILLSNFMIDQGDSEDMRLAIAAPSQDSSEDFLLGLKYSTFITKEYLEFLRPDDITARDFGVRAAESSSLSISADDSIKSEGNGGMTSFTFKVLRAGDTSGTASVDFSVSGSGSNPADATDFGETFPGGQINFAANELQKIITVVVSGDTDVEPNEGFTVRLLNPSGNLIISSQAAEGLIVNDDTFTASVSVTSTVHKVEGDTGTVTYSFIVNRQGDISGMANVEFFVTGSGPSPVDGEDFGGLLPQGQVSFASNESQKSILVTVVGDLTDEPDEGFAVNLRNASSNVAITDGSTEALIIDDDHLVDTQIVNPTLIAPKEVTPGSEHAELILLRAQTETTLTVARLGAVTPLDPAVRLINRDLVEIPTDGDVGVYTAVLESGQTYALIFDGSDADRSFLIRSAGGIGSLSGDVGTNFLLRFDVNADGNVTALDALQIINELARRAILIVNAAGTNLSSGRYYNVNADKDITALDALQVINELAHRQTSGQSELILTGITGIAVASHNAHHSIDVRGGGEVRGEGIDARQTKVATFAVGSCSAGQSPMATADEPQKEFLRDPSLLVDRLLSDDRFLDELR